MNRKLAHIETIIEILPHNNADTLEICKILGWTLCVMKGQFKKGQQVVFIEPDAILPEGKQEWEFMRARGFRLKTIKLRGVISQGLVFPLSILPPALGEVGSCLEGLDVTEILNIKKYTPYIPANLAGVVKGNFPEFLHKTDEERVQNVPDVLQRHKDKRFQVTEKVDGTSATYFYYNGEFGVCSRNLELKEDVNNAYWKKALELDLKGRLIALGGNHAIQGELLGCFHYKTPIRTDKGNQSIGTIYRDFHEGKDINVLSYNKETQLLEYNKIKNVLRQPMNDEWLSLEYRKRRRGGRGCHIVTTPKHIFFTKDLKEVHADSLNIGDVVYQFTNKKLSYIQEQVILGSLLGDGTFLDNQFSVSHSEKQLDYFLYKKLLLSSIVTSTYNRISGFGSKMHVFNTLSIHDKISFDVKALTYKNNKKEVSLEYLNKLSPLAWAFWYMDDGTLNTFEGKQDKCSLATLGFSESSVDNIVCYFNSKGIECNKYLIKNGNNFKPHLQFTVNGTKAFQVLIAPYIHESMFYKLSEEFRHKTEFFNLELLQTTTGVIETVIININRGSSFAANRFEHSCSKYKYDIEVENNHNFFANNILVHNSGIQSNKYNLSEVKLLVFNLFNIDKNKYYDAYDLVRIVGEMGLETVPLVDNSYTLPSTVDELVEYSKGPSILNKDTHREGVIFRPIYEAYDVELHRLSFKVINMDFLLKYND